MTAPRIWSAERLAFAAALGITAEQWADLASSCTTDQLVTIHELLRPRTHRSAFRKSCALQVRAWLLQDQRRPLPLSPKQFEGCRPRWPVHVVFPK